MCLHTLSPSTNTFIDQDLKYALALDHMGDGSLLERLCCRLISGTGREKAFVALHDLLPLNEHRGGAIGGVLGKGGVGVGDGDADLFGLGWAKAHIGVGSCRHPAGGFGGNTPSPALAGPASSPEGARLLWIQ